jgi:Tfp pilus assembly protein PilN
MASYGNGNAPQWVFWLLGVILTVTLLLQGWHFHETVENGKLLTHAIATQQTNSDDIRELKADTKDLGRRVGALEARPK